jgi:hypothetical protein
MAGLLIYSTNVFLKQFIQARYQGDIHYVWCSEDFDSQKMAKYSAGALVPPSSNPADIYRELKRDVEGRDTHSAKIAAQKASFLSLALKWEKDGKISSSDRDDITYMVTTASIDMWRPLIYVIPRAPVEHRLQVVPMSQRAGFGPEYIISDLQRSEFDLLEL